jgi:hypothetical protein
MYLLKLGCQFWKHPFQELFTMAVHGVFVLFFLILFSLHREILRVYQQMQAQNVTIVFLSPAQVASHESQIKAVKIALAQEKDIVMRLMTPTDFLEKLKQGFQTHPFDQEQIKEHIPTYLEISGALSDWGFKKLQTLSEVDSVESVVEKNKPYFMHFYAALLVLKAALIGFMMSLCVICFWVCRKTFSILNQNLDILRLWGASQQLIFVPAALRVFLLSIGSFAISALLWWVLKRFSLFWSFSQGNFFSFLLKPFFLSQIAFLVFGVYFFCFTFAQILRFYAKSVSLKKG